PHADEATGHQAGAATADASADSPAGAIAEASRHRLLQLSRGADKCSEAGRIPFPCHPSLVAHAAAAKPERLDDDGTDRAVGRGLAPKPRILHPWPDARFAVRHPRWEPYARIGHVRI